MYLAVSVLASVYTTTFSAPSLGKQALNIIFSPGDCDTTGECYPFFRIPALKRGKSGALLAFAEARGGHSHSGNDHGDVQIVVRQSMDGTGNNGTWGKIYKVANEQGHTIGNPSPVVDLQTGTVYCHFARDNYDAFVTSSTDEGITWSNRTALDSAIKVPKSTWYGSGVGGGTQLSDGRMMILSEERLAYCSNPETHCLPCNKSENCLTEAYNAVPVYSDDHGTSWKRASFLPVAHNATNGPGEPSVALLGGGDSKKLVMAGRGAAAPHVSVAMSTDGGTSWSETQVIQSIDSPGCQNPISGTYGGGGAIITSPTGRGRGRLKVFYSDFESNLANWTSLGELWGGQAGYSSLLAKDPLDVAEPPRGGDYFVAFEIGNLTGPMYEYIGLITFTLNNEETHRGSTDLTLAHGAANAELPRFLQSFPASPPPPLVCGRTACADDNDCNDPSGSCTYCTKKICNVAPGQCGKPNPPPAGTKPYLMIGDSISIGIEPQLFAALARGDGSLSPQHIKINGGPASKGAKCIDDWTGDSIKWDVATFNFGLHSLDYPATTETENITQYTKELVAITKVLQSRAKTVIWVSTTPVPLNVTIGPGRRNRDVIKYNKVAAAVMQSLGVKICDAYGAVMRWCMEHGNSTGSPDFTYESCALQDPGGVHFQQQGYAVLADAMFECIEGSPAPPAPPAWQSCEAAEEKYCPGEAGKGSECCSCVAKNHPAFTAAGCMNNFTNSSHPAVEFCHAWCKT